MIRCAGEWHLGYSGNPVFVRNALQVLMTDRLSFLES